MQILLNHLKEDRCSVCGAEISSIRQDSRHCSGEWNEYVLYRCGRALHYSPNFCCVHEESSCPHDGIEKERRKSATIFYNAVVAFVRKTECSDPQFKEKVLYWIETCKPR